MIPFSRPFIPNSAVIYTHEVVTSQGLRGDPSFSSRCRSWLEQTCGSPAVLLTTSCTHSLEMCALLTDIGLGDEVIIPSFTFPSTANAFILRGAKMVCVDIRPDTLNIDEAKSRPQ